MLNTIKRIMELLRNYKEQVDALARDYDVERQEHHQKAIEMRAENCYTDSFLDEFERNFKPTRDYKSKITTMRNVHINTFEGLADRLKSYVYEFFNGAISQDFANKIQSITSTGLQLSDVEFEILEKETDSYLSKRLFNQLALKRVDDNGNPSPYPLVDVPDAYLVRKAIDDFINDSGNLLKLYCGTVVHAKQDSFDTQNVEYSVLYDYADIDERFGMKKAYTVNSDSILRDDRGTKLIDFIVSEGIAKLDEKKPLSEDEKDILNTLIEPEIYVYSVKDRVKECAKNSLIRDMLLRDERFAEYVPTE